MARDVDNRRIENQADIVRDSRFCCKKDEERYSRKEVYFFIQNRPYLSRLDAHKNS